MLSEFTNIYFDSEKKVFHLKAKDTSYIMRIIRDGYLAHIYFGKAIKEYNIPDDLIYLDRGFSPNPYEDDRTFSLDTLPQEYPAYGNTDFRSPAYQIQLENGSTITDLRYKKHRIFKGKPKLEGLPATYVESDDEAETIEIHMVDDLIELKVILSYTVYKNFNVITRTAKFINNGNEKLKILRALSMNIDFRNADFDFLHLHGAHCRERHIERRSLFTGIQSIESRRGASSHQQNPFIALLSKNADEDHGEVYGFNLVYSGNFIAQAEVDQFQTTRIQMGINPFDFSWILEPGEEFQCPEVVLVYSSNGLGEMSRIYHDLYRTRLCRGVYRDRERPILINNWEATYFDFNAEKIENIAKSAKELGIELFVLDDGWFSRRDDDKSSLGDWFVNKRKLPYGLKDIVDKVHNLGMKFGLWVEPEMVSEDSELFRKHPDWFLHVPNRKPSVGRNQLILDLSRKEVCDEVIKMISEVLSSAPINYVKWDMNRHMTEIGSKTLPGERQRETAHRYMLGLYRVLEELTSAFPNILFEGCSGGGGRFDPGMLYYMPQTWTSDNTDAISRLKIQYGTSIVYPIITMGAHVSAIPNHQVGRGASIDIRGHVAMSGNFGYELDLTKLTDEEKLKVKEQIKLYKDIRRLIQFGDFYRIINPFETNEAAWIFVSKDKTEAIAFYFRVLGEANVPLRILRLKGLDGNRKYEIIETGSVYGGDELMNVGISIPYLNGDFRSRVFRLKEK
ncbi:Alpha-galactosidase [Caloramator mitchellensis]|uniref:Alpha-galactosidase n=1 Tax=Caloramator mitchellensis TaxID=908809 RepID=A0A0R3JZE9_CALMK|nr:alpha-galactosidase [Caloramator mitchellensis]KRQ86516.1 Alpha-galactosidase [Caloramator mitchellensis]